LRKFPGKFNDFHYYEMLSNLFLFNYIIKSFNLGGSMIKRIALSLIFLFAAVSFLSAQTGNVSQPIVKNSIYNDTSIPLRNMVEVPISQTNWEDGIIPLREIPPVDRQYEKDPALQKFKGTDDAGTIIENFDGVPAGTPALTVAPPDPSFDVGPNHVMQMVNLAYQIWDKNGNSLLGPFNLGTIWAGFPGPWSSSLNDGDPVVLYDQEADRWFASEFSLPNGGSGPEYILVAISQTGDPTGAWYRYGFEFPQFPDYPHYGVWPDGYYMSVNRFAPSFTGTYTAAFERDSMLIGAPAQLVYFTNSTAVGASFLPSDWDGITAPPGGAPNYFTALGINSLRTYEFHVDWITPANSTFTGPLITTTSPFSEPGNIPQLGTSTTLDDLADRLMQRLQYRNFGTHQTMVTCHSIDAGGSRSGVRWYELRNTGSGWSLFQEGTYAPTDGQERWMGSIAMNGDGDIALGYTVSSSSINPEIRYTGRHDGDPLGIMTITEGTIHASGGSQTGGLSRWGDYSQMSVDPVDDNTFWYTHEYIPSNGSFNWRTRIASFTLGAPCPVGFPLNPNPANGAIDVPITLVQLSWDNGAGATENELWFGESGSMVLVHSGSLISSWPIPSNLLYNTSYQWSIIEKSDTCSVNGPIWSFKTIGDPDIVIDTVKVYPQSVAYWTGTTNGTTKTDDSEIRGLNSEDGWFMFDISAIPDVATITQVMFYGYVNATNWPYWSATPLPVLDPLTASASDLKTVIEANSGTGVAYLFRDEDSGYTPGWKNHVLENTANVDLQAALAQDWFAMGMDSRDNTATYFINWDGWFQTNVPYLEVLFEYIVPVELTSFAAVIVDDNIQLNWTTATEINNQGFEIQRRTGNGEFEKVGYVPGHGTTTDIQIYSYVESKVASGSYTYRLKQIDFNGTFEYSDAVEVVVTVPLEFALEQNYPNPFNPSTIIKYSIPENGYVTLDVYNLLGEKVASLVNGVQEAGRYEINFDASNLASGIYIYNLKSGSFNSVKKMLLMK
jgi:hypothetical protein